MSSAVQPTPAPNVELELAKLANEAMQDGADPHATTRQLHDMIGYLRAFPKMAEHATNALADGVATPADITRALAPHVKAYTGAQHASVEPTADELESSRIPISGALANIAQGIPGAEAAEAGVRSLVRGQSYREALSDIQTATGRLPTSLKVTGRMVGASPLMAMLPGSAATSGAIVGGGDELLSANPDESPLARGLKTVGGAAGGALLGKGLDAVGSGLMSVFAKNPAAKLLQMQADRAASAKQLFQSALAQGRANEVSPQVNAFLKEDDIAPIVEKIQGGRTGAQMDTPQLLDRVYKELSDMERQARKPLQAATDPTKPNALVSRLADIRAAKNRLLDVISSPGQKPPLTMEIPEANHVVEPQITPERETVFGAIPEGGHAGADKLGLKAINPNGSVEGVDPRAVQGPRGPGFLLRGQPQVVKPGVQIGAPDVFVTHGDAAITPMELLDEKIAAQKAGMSLADYRAAQQAAGRVRSPATSQPSAIRVQTAPAEDLPPLMPDYKKAVQDFAQRSKEIDAFKRGYEAYRARLSGNLPTANNLTRKTPQAFAEWLKTATPDEIAAARQGVRGGAGLSVRSTLNPLRAASRAGKASDLLRLAPSTPQTYLEALQNLGLLTAGAQTTNP